MLWDHLWGGLDLYAVFDRIRRPGLGQGVSEKQILRLVRRGDLLEEIDLENLVYQVRLDEERFRSQQIQDSDRYVVLVIKCPMVALRYQLSTGEVRRIQMNFSPESGYEVTVRIFRALGVPIQDKNLSEPARHGSAGILPSSQNLQSRLGNSAAGNGSSQMKTDGTSSFHGLLSCSSPEYLDIRGTNAQYKQVTSDIPPILPTLTSLERPISSYNYPLSQSSIPDRYADRPATAPITISQLMPPRRELPFPPEPIETTAGSPAEDTNHSVTLGNTKGQKVSNGTKGSTKSKAKGRASRPSSSRAKPQPSSKQKPAKDQSTIRKPDLETAEWPSTSEVPPPSSSTVRPSAAKGVLTEASPSRINTRSKSSAVIEPPVSVPEQFSKDFENITPEEYMSRLDHWIRNYQDFPAPKPPVKPMSTDKDQLAAYAAQTENERLKALDGMICDYLEDENFVKLVEDVSKSWTRIGLGF
ncbi:MAG: hypothetical protein Q9219_000399 [cf. Caloplaca sp. 3 TL-2023]